MTEESLIRNFRRSQELRDIVLATIAQFGELAIGDILKNKALTGALADLESEGRVEPTGDRDEQWRIPYRIVPEAQRDGAKQRLAMRNLNDMQPGSSGMWAQILR